ncbi:MAG: HAD family hydrolase [Candidatus Helarchaeales archaeon]
MTIKAVIFDLYRTLIDPTATKNPDEETYQFLQEKFGVQATFEQFKKKKEEIYIKYFKQRDTPPFNEIEPKYWWKEIVESLSPSHSSITEDDLEGIIRLRNGIWMPRTRLYPEVREVLEHLKHEQHLKLGVITNISRGDFARKNMDYLHVTHFFDVILTSAEEGIRKPHPLIFKQALSRLGVNNSETIFCGDTRWDDVKGARDAGIFAVLVERPNTGTDGHPTVNTEPLYFHHTEVEPDHVVKNLKELIPLIDKMNGK